MHRSRVNYYLLLIIMMCAFEVILSFVGVLGYVDLGGHLNACTLFLPVAAAAVMLGPGAGAFVGLLLGFCRFVVITFLNVAPLPVAAFSPTSEQPVWSTVFGLVAPVVAGVLTGIISRKLSRVLRSRGLCFALAGAFGGFANWALTFLCIFLLHHNELTEALGAQPAQIALSALQTAAIAETLAAALICALPCAMLYRKYISND